MTKFIFIPANIWAEWDLPQITFFGNSGHYYKLPDGEIIIIYDGVHVATKINSIIFYNTKELSKLPFGLKSAISKINKLNYAI